MTEKIIAHIAGIMRTGFHLRGSAVLGTGKIRTAENAMLITDKRIIFVVVPVKGAETIVASTDIAMWQYMLSKKGIEEKLKTWMKGKSPQTLLKSNPKNYAIELKDIQKVKFNKFFNRGVVFMKKDGTKRSYAIRDKADLERAKKLFANFL